MRLNIYLFLTFIIYFFLINIVYSYEIIWEKENDVLTFPVASTNQYPKKIIECDNKYFMIYFQTILNGSLVTNYPAICAFDEFGTMVLHNDNTINEIDSIRNRSKGVENFLSMMRACKCFDDTLKIEMPLYWLKENNKHPVVFSFNTKNGEIYNDAFSYPPEGTTQIMQTSNAEFTNDQLFILSRLGLTGNSIGRIDVYDHFNILKFRIRIPASEFYDSIYKSSPFSKFLFVDEKYFFVDMWGSDYLQNGNRIIAKFDYNKTEADNATQGQIIEGNLIWYANFIPKRPGLNDMILLKNGNLLLKTPASLVVINENGEVIENSSFESNNKLDKYSLTNMTELDAGYIAFYNTFNDNGNKKFAIVITDYNFNVIEEIVWDYNNCNNNLFQIIEKENGNLFVFGHNEYSDDAYWGIYKVPYFAEIKPGYITSVKETSYSHTLSIHPNPGGDILHIENGNPHSAIEIYSVLGIIQMRTAYTNRIDVSRLPAGVYFLRSGSEVVSFVK